MAHSFVNKSQVNDQTGTSISHDHTPGSACTLIIVSVVVGGTTARTGGAPTIGGVTALQADIRRVGLEQAVEIWYRCAPFPETATTVVVPNAGSLTCHLEVVSATAGTGYGSSLHNASGDAWADDTADGGTVSVTSSAIGDFLYCRLGVGEGAVGSTSESSTNPTKVLTYENDHGAYCSEGHYGISDAAGTESFIYTWTNDDGCACAGAWSTALAVDAPDAAIAFSESRTVALAALAPFPSDQIAFSETKSLFITAEPAGDLNVRMVYT